MSERQKWPAGPTALRHIALQSSWPSVGDLLRRFLRMIAGEAPHLETLFEFKREVLTVPDCGCYGAVRERMLQPSTAVSADLGPALS
jgi:hypothetical protein